jgi:hypothetical protein
MVQYILTTNSMYTWLTPAQSEFYNLPCEANAMDSMRSVKLRHLTREEVERAIRENYQLLDEVEPGMYLGVFPLGYRPINTLK